MDKSNKTFVQKLTGKFLYYVMEVDSMMLVALSSITLEQANPKNTKIKN